MLALVQYLLQKDSEEHHFYTIDVLRRMLGAPEAQMAVVSSVKNITAGMVTCGQA